MSTESDGNVAWTALHLRALSLTMIDPPAELAWLASWLKGDVSCGACRNGGEAWVKVHPPDLSSPRAYFDWTTDFHNGISATLGKSQWTHEQSYTFWSKFMSDAQAEKINPADLDPTVKKTVPDGPERQTWSLSITKDVAGATANGNRRRYILQADGAPFWLGDTVQVRFDAKTVAKGSPEAAVLLALATFFAAKGNE